MVFFTGAEALTAVGTTNGVWNWAMVGGVLDELPLAGGGPGGVHEMQDCLINHKADVVFGLIRVSITGVQDKFIFVAYDAANEDLPAAERRKGMEVRVEIEKAIRKFANVKAVLDIHSPEDFTIECVLETAKKVSTAESDKYSEEAYNQALENFTASLPEEFRTKEQADGKLLTADTKKRRSTIAAAFHDEDEDKYEIEVGEDEKVAIEAAKVEPAPAVEQPSEGGYPTKSSEASGRFKKGQHVFIFGTRLGAWHTDGVISNILSEAGEHDGLQLPVGSMKVVYLSGTRGKWVTPEKLEEYIVEAFGSPAPPETKMPLLKQTFGLLPEWKDRMFRLKDGYIQYWKSRESCDRNDEPASSYPLWGTQIQTGPPLSAKKFNVRLASGGGLMYSLAASSPEVKEEFISALKLQKAYSEEFTKYMAQVSSRRPR